jgi:phage terminase small subunit
MEITIRDIQQRWNISRPTIYKHIRQGKLSRLENGKVDVSEVLRVYGEPKETQTRQEIDTVDTQEKALLLEKIRLLESQLDDARERESWLKSQVETAQTTIKLLEYRQPVQSEKRQGLFARVVKAITE